MSSKRVRGTGFWVLGYLGFEVLVSGIRVQTLYPLVIDYNHQNMKLEFQTQVLKLSIASPDAALFLKPVLSI